ncbi:hypothetical protein CHUAL_004133 [Chamberlinius hualienensis]
MKHHRFTPRRWRTGRLVIILAFVLIIMFWLTSSMWKKFPNDESDLSSPEQFPSHSQTVTNSFEVKKLDNYEAHLDEVISQDGPQNIAFAVHNDIVHWKGNNAIAAGRPNADGHEVNNDQQHQPQKPDEKVKPEIKVKDELLLEEDSNDGDENYKKLRQRYANIPLREGAKINDAISVVRKIVMYYTIKKEEQNTDTFIALRMLEEQTELLFQKMAEKDGLIDGVSINVIYAMNNAKIKAKALLTEANRIVSKTTANYTELVELFSPKSWKIYNEQVDLMKFLKDNHNYQVLLKSDHADRCYVKMTGSSDGQTKPCSVDDDCWNEMTTSGMSGFSATKQLLYLLVGQSHKCEKTMEEFASKNKQVSFASLYSSICATMYDEMTTSLAKKTAIDGLTYEQIFLCGMAGFKEFCLPKVLEVLKSSQSASGCFIDTSTSYIWETIYNFMSIFGMKNTSSQVCVVHKTAAALGAAMQYVRYLIELPHLFN